ncbi:MAG: Rpn family recombination-promoting nuclease/putative transposase [Methyloprofundus sp.]|nr:Rpn family recombination-promoting nuclease/putative transposase [Methyloprofundus sp.]
MKFADPTNDIAFKKIFGDKNKQEILISFLNAVLGFKKEKTISNVIIANPYQVPKIEELKETILDIKATNQAGENFIIEIQKKDLGNFSKRTLYYTAKAYVEQLDKGNDYSKLKKVYFIGLLNFNMFTSENFISRHLILNQETKNQDLDDFEFSFIELKKFNKNLSDLENNLDKWVYFLKHAKDLTLIPKEFESIKEFTQAFEIVSQYNWNKQELEVYDYIALKEYDEINALETAEKKGLRKGIEKVALTMLKENTEIELIMKFTGLSKPQLNALKIKHNL